MSTHKKASQKTPDQIRRELEARVAALKAQPVDPELERTVALREAVADHVFEIMQARGIKKAELARRLGKSPAYVSKLLGGGANLTLDSLSALGAALGCRLEVRFGSEGRTAAPLPRHLRDANRRRGLNLKIARSRETQSV